MRSRSNLFKRMGLTFFMICLLRSTASAQMVAGPILGDIGEDHAQLWVRTQEASQVRWTVSTREDFSLAETTPSAASLQEHNFSVTLKTEHLKPATTYFYNVLINGTPVWQKDYPSFTTATSAGQSTHLRIAFSSCLGHKAQDSDPQWAQMAERPFDLLLLLGDQHYADTTDVTVLRDQYLVYRSNGDFRRIAQRKPVYTIWDDHDYGGNDTDSTLPGKEGSLMVFKEVWPNPGFGESGNPGVYYSFIRGDVEFFMLDGRYYRVPKLLKNGRNKTMLGARQLQWLKEGLSRSKAKVKIIVSGVEINGAGGKDSWAYYRHERKELLDFIITQKIEGVLFLSGDSHYTAAFQMKEGFLEITSGPLGSSPSVPPKNPYLFKTFNRGHYFSILDIDTTLPEPSIRWEVEGNLLDAMHVQEPCTLDWKSIIRQKPARCLEP